MPQATAATTFLQGIEVPAESVNPALFFALTRRKQTQEKATAFAGLGFTDIVELRKSDILAEIRVRGSGSITVTLGGGTCATTCRWPYDLLRVAKFTANGASNLINMGGLQLKAREQIANPNVSDRGVGSASTAVGNMGGTVLTQGTLSSSSEAWGVGTVQTAIAAGTYTFNLTWVIPVAEDQTTLAGAIFLATTSTDLTLSLQWATSADLFVLTGAATAVVAMTYQVVTKKFSIPVQNGNIVVPELNLFHSCVSFRKGDGLAAGANEVRLPGQGIGKSLLRVVFNVYNGASSFPLQMSATNFGDLFWRYGNNETPDDYPDGAVLRQELEHLYNSDVGGFWGYGAMEFAAENGFRDAVDEGTTSDLRIGITIAQGVSLSTPAIEGFTETVWLAGEAA